MLEGEALKKLVDKSTKNNDNRSNNSEQADEMPDNNGSSVYDFQVSDDSDGDLVEEIEDLVHVVVTPKAAK
jgi:hypothetical protein